MKILMTIFRSSILFFILIQNAQALDLVMGLNHSARPLDSLNDDRLNAVLGLSHRFELKEDVSLDVYAEHESRLLSSDYEQGRNKIGFDFIIHLRARRIY